MEDDDLVLFRAALAGDARAQVSFVKRHEDRIKRLAARYVGEQDADDVAQKVFIKAFKNGSSFDGKARVSTWLHPITVNTARDHIRSHQRKNAREEPSEFDTFAAPENDELETKRVLKIIAEALEHLTEEQRDAVIFCDFEGLDPAQAAAELGIHPSKLNGRLQRGRTRLRERLIKGGLGAAFVALLVGPTRARAWTTTAIPAAAALAIAALLATPFVLSRCSVDATRAPASADANTAATSSSGGRGETAVAREVHTVDRARLAARSPEAQGSSATETSAIPPTTSVADAWAQFGVRDGFASFGQTSDFEHVRLVVNGEYIATEPPARYSTSRLPSAAGPNGLEVDSSGRIRLGPSTWSGDGLVDAGMRCGLNRDCEGGVAGRYFFVGCHSEAVCDSGQSVALPTTLVTGVLATTDELIGNVWIVDQRRAVYIAPFYWSAPGHRGCWWEGRDAVDLTDAEVRSSVCGAHLDLSPCSEEADLVRPPGSLDAWTCPSGTAPPLLTGDRVLVVMPGSTP